MMSSIVRTATSARFSRTVIYNGIVFVTGQIADDLSQTIEGQTRQALANIEMLLTEADTDKSRLLSALIWLKDITRDFGGMNSIWDEWTAPNASPTRATAQCEMAIPEVLVEIIVTAAVKEQPGELMRLPIQR